MRGGRIFTLLRRSGLPALLRSTVQKRRITILVLHELRPDLADQAFGFLGRAYSVVPLARAVEAILRKDRSALPPRPLVITFDDGRMSNRALLPAITKHRMSVTIFLCAGVAGTSRHFWFSHESPARHDPRWKRLSRTERLASLYREGFAFEAEYGDRQALSRAEIEVMRPFVDFQSHSMFHENILTCGEDDLWRAVIGSKKTLEGQFGLAIEAFAYPAGDYALHQIEIVKQAGYRCAVTMDPGFNSVRSDPFLLKRLEGLGDEAAGTLDEIIVRASGALVLPKALTRLARKAFRRLRTA